MLQQTTPYLLACRISCRDEDVQFPIITPDAVGKPDHIVRLLARVSAVLLLPFKYFHLLFLPDTPDA